MSVTVFISKSLLEVCKITLSIASCHVSVHLPDYSVLPAIWQCDFLAFSTAEFVLNLAMPELTWALVVSHSVVMFPFALSIFL